MSNFILTDRKTDFLLPASMEDWLTQDHLARFLSTHAGSTVKNQRVLDHHYRARHLVENLFQRMKIFRHVATRHDKLDVTYLGFVHIAGTMKRRH